MAAELTEYSKEFLPHAIKLVYPQCARPDTYFNYFQQLFALNRPEPEQSCVLVKGRDRLLGFAYLTPLQEIQPGLVFMHLALDEQLDSQSMVALWNRCYQMAEKMVQQPVTFRLAIAEDSVPASLTELGFKLVREQVEFRAPLDSLPVMYSSNNDFEVDCLAQRPDWEDQWVDVFNDGLTVFSDLPMLDANALRRLRRAPGFDAQSFRLGVGQGEPAVAAFYSVVSASDGLVRVNAASTSTNKRSKGYGRAMLKDMLTHLEEQGYGEAVIYSDAVNQATRLLFKMLGFLPQRTIKILEASPVSVNSLSQPVGGISPGYYPCVSK